jgi:hypothetical protein
MPRILRRSSVLLSLISCFVLAAAPTTPVSAAKRPSVVIGNITFDEAFGKDFSGCSEEIRRTQSGTTDILVSDLDTAKMRLDGKIRTMKVIDTKNWSGGGYTVVFRGTIKPVGEEGFAATGTLVVKRGTVSTTIKAYLDGGC